jgi:DNA-binding transcriptional MerR regulator
MKINEVEALAGISKKNIRFYEEQGLLSPRRNSENGYRDYGEAEVDTLRRIKLLRKLGVSIEDIRRMLSGEHTVADGMRRHLITLERERRNLELSAELCRELQSEDVPLGELIRGLRDLGLEIESLQTEKDTTLEDGARPLVATLKTKKRGDHNLLIEKIKKLPGIIHLEEL